MINRKCPLSIIPQRAGGRGKRDGAAVDLCQLPVAPRRRFLRRWRCSPTASQSRRLPHWPQLLPPAMAPPTAAGRLSTCGPRRWGSGRRAGCRAPVTAGSAGTCCPAESDLPLPPHAQGGRRPGEAVSAHIKRCRRAGQRRSLPGPRCHPLACSSPPRHGCRPSPPAARAAAAAGLRGPGPAHPHR